MCTCASVRLCVCAHTVKVSASPLMLLRRRGDSIRKPLNVKENSADPRRYPAEQRDGRESGREVSAGEHGAIPHAGL